MLEKEWEFYETHKKELVKKYLDKIVVISGDKVIASYDDENEAYNKTIGNIPLGSFMMHHITDPEEVIHISPFISGRSL